MLLTDAQGVLEEFPLRRTGFLNLLQDTHIDFLPETGHRRHTRRVGLLHRLLHFQRIGIHNQRGSLRQAKDLPAFLEDMGKRQEVEHTVLLTDGHAFVVGLHRGMILPASQDDALRITRRT